MLYTDRTKTFAVSSFSAVMEIANKYAQINKIGDYDGQCVSFVKALCGFSTLTPNWKKGEQLSSTSPIQRWTAIATFFWDSDTYSGHTGIFIRFYTNLSTKEKWIEVLDQNWGEWGVNEIVRIHKIAFKNPSVENNVGDAWNYYVINV